MDSALGPLDLVKYSKEKPPAPLIETDLLERDLEDIVLEAAGLINADSNKEFLYKNPNGWQLQGNQDIKMVDEQQNCCVAIFECVHFANKNQNTNSVVTFAAASNSTTSEENEDFNTLVSWCKIKNFEISLVVRQINEFIQTWDLTPATKFVVITSDKIENIAPFGERHFVEAHFSTPTPKCPNPLAIAKVYFYINICKILPNDYPVNVTYKFEGYQTLYYAMGVHKLSSNKFQRYFIDTILHMKLAFYAELCDCRNPLKPLETPTEKSGKLDKTTSA